MDWTFDKSVYAGFEIESLKFDRIEPGNLIKVSLTLHRDALKEPYETVRYVQCYNFDTDCVRFGVIGEDADEGS